MEAIALLLLWCVTRISFEVEVSTKRRKATRIRIGFGAYIRRPPHVDDDDE
jgi:hypothetical protein